jgi:hypothetical protein
MGEPAAPIKRLIEAPDSGENAKGPFALTAF